MKKWDAVTTNTDPTIKNRGSLFYVEPYAIAPSDVRKTLAKEEALHSSEMRLRIKKSRPKNINEAVWLAVQLDAFNEQGLAADIRNWTGLQVDASATGRVYFDPDILAFDNFIHSYIHFT